MISIAIKLHTIAAIKEIIRTSPNSRIFCSEIQKVTLQKKMVENAVRYLKEGGYLLYSTCTINRAENEEVVEYIRENLNLTVECMTALYPDEHDTDGFFFARCKK